MATRVRSYSKINLGLAIGPPRPDGFHGLSTLYQTLALHDLLTVSAQLAPATRLTLRSNDPRVPVDGRNTVWKMVESALQQAGLTATVEVHIQKNLPIQGGMGAGSANAAAALLGLERELSLTLSESDRLSIAGQVGSDVPLFLIGGSVLGTDRGQVVEAVPDLTLGGKTSIPCVIALPGIGVSTPAAFREWDRCLTSIAGGPDLHNQPVRDRLNELSCTFASIFTRPASKVQAGGQANRSGASGIFPDPYAETNLQHNPENLQGLSREQRHIQPAEAESGIEDDLAENSLLALVRTGIENDFETVVFPQYPLLRDIKRHLMGPPETGSIGPAGSASSRSALYAALSGSGSALFGLYRTLADADAAQQRLQENGVKALVTVTMPRPLYWSSMFAD